MPPVYCTTQRACDMDTISQNTYPPFVSTPTSPTKHCDNGYPPPESNNVYHGARCGAPQASGRTSPSNTFLRGLNDTLAVRRTCKMLADVGLDYVGHTVPLILHRDKLRTLEGITKYPGIAQRMRSLVFGIERCIELDFDAYAEIWYGMGAYGTIWEHAEPTPFTSQGLFKMYRDLCQDQVAIIGREYDFRRLRMFFKHCPQIRGTAIARLPCIPTMLPSSRILILPHVDLNRPEAGVHEIFTVARAVANAGIILDSLTLVDLSHELFLKVFRDEGLLFAC